MARPPSVPKLCQHKASGKAVVRLNGQDHYLGVFGTPEAKAAYDRLIAEWLANGRRSTNEPEKSPLSPGRVVDEVLLAFFQHAERHYRLPDGTPTSEVREIRHSLRPVHELYGQTPADAFGPKSLAAVRQTMIDKGLCRKLVNKRIDRVKRAFKWAVAEELVPVSVYQGLRTLAGLQKGRTAARESDPVKPVEPAHVAATLPHLGTHLQTMVELQRLTGMRPGEVCGLTLAEVNRVGAVWVYRPADHKTAHRGKARVIPIGPRARALLVTFLRRDGTPPAGFAHVEVNNPDHRDARLVMVDAYEEAGRVRDAVLLRDAVRSVLLVEGCVVDPFAPLFSPAESREEWARTARAKRKSKVPPSQMKRRATKPKRAPGGIYKITAYGHAVRKAAERAGVPHWHPNQLRHTFATEVRRTHGLEAAQVALGHSKADVTQVYAERDFALATRVANEIG